MTTIPSPAEIGGRGAITPTRCTAIRALLRDDMSTREAAFVLEIDQGTVRRHGNGECDCPNELLPIDRDRDGGDGGE